jgi:hypothetical protein
MARLRTLSLLACLTCLLVSAQPGAAGTSGDLQSLTARLSYLRVFSEPQAEECAPKPAEPTNPDGLQEPPRTSPAPKLLDIEALSRMLEPKPPRLKHLGVEMHEIFPLGAVSGIRERVSSLSDPFCFERRLGRYGLLDDRPTGSGFECAVTYPFRPESKLMLGVQAEEGGHAGRSDVRTLFGFSFDF